MAGLALVVPAIRLGCADTVKTRSVGHLAEPSTDIDVGELLGVVEASAGARSEDLGEGTWVKLVDHLAVAGGSTVESVGLELGVLGESREAHLGTVIGDNVHVATRAWGWLWSRGGSGSGLGLLWGGRRSRSVGRLLVLAGRSWLLLVDNSNGRWLVDSLGGRSRGWLLTLDNGDGLDNSLDDVLELLSTGLVGSSEGSAHKGGDSDSGAHVDDLFVV